MESKHSIASNSNNNLNRSKLTTELPNKNSINLDNLPTSSIFEIFSKEDLLPQISVNNAKEQIITAIDSITMKLKNGGRLFYLGAGTSGRLGVLDAAECPPTFCTPPELVQGIIAGGVSSLQKSSEHLEDEKSLAKSDLLNRNFSNKDCLVGISASGTTPYVIEALTFARELKALSIAIACVPKDQSPLICDIDIRLVTGPEILAGSTRLKAGTATKMALNIISTTVMIKLGKVYSNRMVDVSATNNKLKDRSLGIIEDITGQDRSTAGDLLDQANGSVKLAILIALSSLDKNKAQIILGQSGGNLRIALNKLGLKQQF